MEGDHPRPWRYQVIRFAHLGFDRGICALSDSAGSADP